MKNIIFAIQTFTILLSVFTFSTYASESAGSSVIDCHFDSDPSKSVLTLRSESGEDLNFPDQGNFYEKIVPMFINDSPKAVEVLVDRQFQFGRDNAYLVTYTYKNPFFIADFTLKHRTTQSIVFGFYKDDSSQIKNLTCTMGLQ